MHGVFTVWPAGGVYQDNNATTTWMTSSGEPLNAPRSTPSKNQWGWCGKTANVPMAPPFFCGSEASFWLGMLLCQTHLHRSTCGQLSQTGRRCSQSGSQQQGDQIQPVDQDPSVLSGGHWNDGYLTPPGNRTGWWDWKTHHQYHWRCKRDGVSVSAAVRGTSKRGNGVSFQSTLAAS